MNLNLDKQKVTKLSSEEMDNVNGGGRNRSRRLDGDCRYSRNHPVTDGHGGPTVDCHGKGDIIYVP